MLGPSYSFSVLLISFNHYETSRRSNYNLFTVTFKSKGTSEFKYDKWAIWAK